MHNDNIRHIPLLSSRLITDLQSMSLQGHGEPVDKLQTGSLQASGTNADGKTDGQNTQSHLEKQATIIQKHYRGFRTRGLPNAQGYHTIRNTEGQKTLCVRYRQDAGKLAVKKLFPAPERFTPVSNGASGAFKKLAAEYVPKGDRYRNLPRYVLLSAIDTVPPNRLSEHILDTLQTRRLDAILPQHQINKDTWITKKMDESLFDHFYPDTRAKSTSNADPRLKKMAAYKPLVLQLKALHELNFLHRDIKTENLLIRRPDAGPVEVCLSDLDSMTEIGDPAEPYGTRGFMDYSKIFIHYPELKPVKNGSINMPLILEKCGKEMDQFAALKVLMEVISPVMLADLDNPEKRRLWLKLHVKPKYVNDALALSADPVKYSKQSDKVHVADMIDFTS